MGLQNGPVLRVLRARGNTVALVDRMGGDNRGLVSVAKTLVMHAQGFLVIKVRRTGYGSSVLGDLRVAVGRQPQRHCLAVYRDSASR